MDVEGHRTQRADKGKEKWTGIGQDSCCLWCHSLSSSMMLLVLRRKRKDRGAASFLGSLWNSSLVAPLDRPFVLVGYLQLDCWQWVEDGSAHFQGDLKTSSLYVFQRTYLRKISIIQGLLINQLAIIRQVLEYLF